LQSIPSGGARRLISSADATAQMNGPSFWTGQIRRGLLAVGAAGLAVCVLGWWWWRTSHPSPPGDHWQAVARGRAYLDQGRSDLAFQAVSDIRDEAPGSGEAMAIAGLAMIRFGEYRAARLALERALKLQPNQFEAAVTLAELNFDLGNGHRGIEVLEMAARLRPREFRVWLKMGNVLHDMDDLPGAIQAYEKALGLNPSHREALIGMIGRLMDNKQPELAGPWVTKALRRYPDDPAILGLAARRAYDASQLDEALALADRAVARDPENVDALMARARAQVVRAHWEQALPDAERAAAAEPNDRGALQLLLQIETWLGMTERAAATRVKMNKTQERLALMDRLAEEIRSNPEDPKLPWRMGQTACEAGSFLLASRCFEAALALDPSFEPARESLDRLRASQPDLARSSSRSAPMAGAAGRSQQSYVTIP
jgi:tetratricopeptide (TPR) repeat protein